MKTKMFLICVIALALVACAAPASTATPVPPTPMPPSPTAIPPTPVPTPDLGATIKSLSAALNAGNVDAALAFFADDATQTQTPPPTGTTGIRTGKEQIRAFLAGMIADKFNGEVSSFQVAGDKVSYTATFSTDTYRKMGVAPLVAAEEVVIDKGKIKSHTITITPESLAKIQAAMAAQAKAAPPKKVLLLLAAETSRDMELMLTKEVGVMVSLIEKAGYKVVVASASGQPLMGSATTLKPDLKLADVKVEDYAGLILPCLAPSTPQVPPDGPEIVKKAVALGKPVAAQINGVGTLMKAGVLSGKQFAIISGYGFEKSVPDGIYKGEGVVQDGNIVTSGMCPFMARAGGTPDGTTELTQKFIALLASAR